MKTFEVIRNSSGQIGVRVVQQASTPGQRPSVRLLKHCVLHSPTGFETGYAGSGPADLAASILADVYGVNPARLKSVWERGWGLGEGPAGASKVLRLHQLFKQDFISPRKLEPGQSYEISGDDIVKWIAEQESKLGE
jgi:hypothetical protein